ncbi:MAG: ferritin [Ignavibacteriales bacterium CG_4_9_14_3_um_filter_34_10]|nr:MAG: ferritin [Ignavibacteriales bacterium CG_4_9_14_3_um_filter_34_10]
MKNIKITILVALLSSIAFIACSENNIAEPNTNLQANSGLTKDSILSMPYENISPSEQNSLFYMREEEKLARDVYITLFNKYGIKAFNNISKSEQTHTDAIKYILQKYSLDDPIINDVIGVFVNQDLQNLYNKLIAQGYQSDIEALKVGALIEEVDIIDLVKAINEEVDNQDIKLVYNNLKMGSENHLRAFVKNLSARGIIYTPQLLDIDTYNSIVK